MKHVSKEFLEKLGKGASFYQTAKIKFADGSQKELGKRDFYMSGNSFTDGPGINAFPLGEAMSKHVTLVLVNDDDRFSDYDFYMAHITVWLKCDLSETTEEIQIGQFTVTTPESYGSQVTVDAIDDMYKGNEAYTTEIAYPASLGSILRDSCLTCGVNLLSTSFTNDSFIVNEKPEEITHRQLWGMIAMIAGGNARMNENNYLEIKEYDFSYFEKTQLDGGYFDTSTPYISGDGADGGNFTDWSSGDSIDGGTFEELNAFHMFYRTKIPTMATDDVVITGIQTTIDEETYLFGSEGYVLKIENQLLKDNPDAAVALIGAKIVGLRFRPFTVDHMAYPLAEFGDLCYVADRKGNVYQSVVTDVSFNYFGYTTILCSADDPLRNSSKYYSASTEAVLKARQNAKKQLSAYDLAVQQLTNLITNSFGVFKTEEIQEDSSIIYYLHNKPELSTSSTIWKMTTDAFAVSSDGGKTWNAGLDSEGNAVVNVLSAIGINADWLITGKISDEKGENWWDLTNGKYYFGNYATSIANNEKEIEARVKIGELISRINQSAEEVLISAEKLKLEGAVTVNNNVKITDDGKLIAKGSELDGRLVADRVTVVNGYMDIYGDYASPSGTAPSCINIRSTYSPTQKSGGLSYTGLHFSSEDLNDVAVELNASRDLIFYTAADKALWGTWLDETGVWSQSLTISGTKSRKAGTEDYGERLLYCYETPTPMFGDIGEGQIDETGKCYIFLDDIFAETIDTDCVYQVFLQPYGKGECYVTERTPSYFIVEGSTNLAFGWELKAIQKGYDTMRMEVFEKTPREENTVFETEEYLNNIVAADGTIEETENYLNSLIDTDGVIKETETYLESLSVEESEEKI